MRLRLAFALVFFTTISLCAQTFRGGIEGSVIDKSGAAVPGAQVSATSVATGLTRTAQTDSNGDYAITELPLGSYNVTVTRSGFGTQTASGVSVGVSTLSRVDFTLTPGEVKETVEVTAEIPIIETSRVTLGGTIQTKTLEELPINGRDFIKFLVMVPGSTADASGVSDSPGSFGQFSINGNRGRSNNFLLDGTDMNDGYRNDSAINEAGVFGTPATLLPVEALAEMAILNSTEAEYGRNSGATVNIVTKSGTNTLHGSVFEQLRNNWFDARIPLM
ncbi:MAG: carboxypeptidase regulatory-like domain-containing protein [Terriglobales bacterium]